MTSEDLRELPGLNRGMRVPHERTFRTLIYVSGVYGLCHIPVAWIQVLETMSRRI